MSTHRLLSASFGAALIVVVALVIPATAAAQRRGAPPPPVRHAQSVVVVGGGYGYPGWGWYGQWGYPWGYPWGPYGPWGPWGPYGYYYYDAFSASVKLEVKPRNAEVWVDGYMAGIVDDFDGTFQRLKVRPGEHEIVLYLEGYRTVRQRLALATNSGQRIKYEMEPLGPGESSGPRPTPPPEPEPQERNVPPSQRQAGPPPPEPAQQGPEKFGTLSIRVQPADAEILVDGEVWDSPGGQARLTVQLSPGRHHVDVRKTGFESYSEDVLIRAGATLTLNISLLRSHANGSER